MTTQHRRMRRLAVPEWLNDPADQWAWAARFARNLNERHASVDGTVRRILRDRHVTHWCAMRVRCYVDPEVTRYLYKNRKDRVRQERMKIQSAITGLNSAVGIYGGQEPNVAQSLGFKAVELSGALGRCDRAASTKRHGRDRAQSILYECHVFLEYVLRTNVTYKTLANLVSSGFETENLSSTHISEENVRKNLANFRHQNPEWCSLLESRIKTLSFAQSTGNKTAENN